VEAEPSLPGDTSHVLDAIGQGFAVPVFLVASGGRAVEAARADRADGVLGGGAADCVEGANNPGRRSTTKRD